MSKKKRTKENMIVRGKKRKATKDLPYVDPHCENIAEMTGESPYEVEQRLWRDNDMPGYKD